MKGKKLSDRAGGFYLSLLAGILLLLALIRYFMKGGVTEYGLQFQFIASVAAALLLICLSFFTDLNILQVLTAACAAAALAVFVIASINIMTGYFFGLAMFGDVTMMGEVIRVSVLTGGAVVLLIVSAFLKKNKDE